MRRLWNSVCRWFSLWRASFAIARGVADWQAKAARAAEDNLAAARLLSLRREQLDRRERRLAAIQEELRDDLQNARVEIANAERAQLRYVTEIESLRSKLQVAEEVTIPSLTKAHQMTIEAVQAETATQVMRRTGAQPTPGTPYE